MAELSHKTVGGSNKVKHLLLFLGIYIACHYLFFALFFNGFIGGYSFIYKVLSKHGLNLHLLQYVPFHSWSPFLAAFLHPLFALGAILFSIPLIGKFGEIRWENIPNYKQVRLLTFLSAGILTWEFVSYDYNYYLDSAQYIDRFLLIVFALLILRNPVFTLPFLVLSLLYRSQFNYPIGGFPLFDKRLLFDLLIILYAFIVAGRYIKDFKINLLLVLVCAVASNYFASAVAKVIHSPHGYEWLAYNKVEDLFMNVHQCGWMQSMSTGGIENLKGFLQKFGSILQVGVFLTELATILLLWKRRIAIIILSAGILMHIGIFIFGSMLFWKWMAMDLAILIVFLKMTRQEEYAFFNGENFKLSLVFIITSFAWLNPLAVFWFDTPSNQFYTYQVIDDKGNTYNLERNALNPYHQLFQYDKFEYLLNKKCLPISPFGYVNQYALAHKLAGCGANGLQALEDAEGKEFYDTVKAKAYDDFIKTYFVNRNRRTGQLWLASFAAPYHIYNFEGMPVYDGTQKVKVFRAIYNQTYFNGLQVIPVTQKIAHDVEIPEK